MVSYVVGKKLCPDITVTADWAFQERERETDTQTDRQTHTQRERERESIISVSWERMGK